MSRGVFHFSLAFPPRKMVFDKLPIYQLYTRYFLRHVTNNLLSRARSRKQPALKTRSLSMNSGSLNRCLILSSFVTCKMSENVWVNPFALLDPADYLACTWRGQHLRAPKCRYKQAGRTQGQIALGELEGAFKMLLAEFALL